ncbi:hypothetical protein ADUPG1_003373, partial [Aduncisulcus paluster]
MNAQTSSATGYSPFEMVFARRPKEAIDLFPKRLSIDQLKLSNKTAKRESIDFVDNVRETLVAYQEKAIELQEKLRQKRKKNEKESPFVVGCYVWLKPHKKVSKLSEKVWGPFKVVDVGPHYMVEIEDILTDSRFKVHTDRLVIVKGKHSIEELKETAASSQGEYIIEFIVDHRGETEE